MSVPVGTQARVTAFFIIGGCESADACTVEMAKQVVGRVDCLALAISKTINIFFVEEQDFNFLSSKLFFLILKPDGK